METSCIYLTLLLRTLYLFVFTVVTCTHVSNFLLDSPTLPTFTFFSLLTISHSPKGMNVEAVLRVEDDKEKLPKMKNTSHRESSEGSLGLSMLIDSQNNQYVLTKPRDSTMSRADHHFIKVRVRQLKPNLLLTSQMKGP